MIEFEHTSLYCIARIEVCYGFTVLPWEGRPSWLKTLLELAIPKQNKLGVLWMTTFMFLMTMMMTTMK